MRLKDKVALGHRRFRPSAPPTILHENEDSPCPFGTKRSVRAGR
jgi:hypothetical protein